MNSKKSYLGPLMIIGVLFFVFGFITWVNATLIEFFRKAFSLSNTQAYLVTFAFYISYTVMAIPSSKVLEKVGFKKGMSLGLFVMSVGTMMFIPAAKAESYPFFLIGLFTIGVGLTLLQTASNPYVTILGPIESAAQRISFMGITNKMGGIVSQKVVGGILLTGTAAIGTGNGLDKVAQPYMYITGGLLLLAICIWFMKGLPEVEPEEEEVTEKGGSSIWSHTNFVLGLVALFCCVGIEVIAGDTIISYGGSLGFSEHQKANFGTYALGAMLLGYILGIVLTPKIVSQHVWLQVSSTFGIVVALGAVFTSGFTSVIFVALFGLANAIMWPAIWPLALRGLGKHMKLASALLIMMIAGGAIMPVAYGSLADYVGEQTAYLITIPMFAYVLYFAAIGHKK